MIFILAAGQQTRWEGDGFKQLLPIGETTILERTVWQLQARGLDYGPVYGSSSMGLGRGFYSKIRRFTSETLLSTLGQYGPVYESSSMGLRNTILLGDVIYSHKTLDRILNCQEPIRWFGNPWEIFAISFDDTVASKIALRLRQTIEQAEQGRHVGKLRNFYHTYCNIEQENDTEHNLFGKVCSITDYTNDIDTLEEYENFLKQHLATMIHDDNNYKANN